MHNEIRDVINRHKKAIMAVNGVVGIAEGVINHDPCIRIFVTKKDPEILKQLPDIIDSYPVIVEESGKFEKRS